MKFKAFTQLKSSGFAIIEAMISLIVISSGMLGLAAMHSTLIDAAENARHRVEAVRLANDQVEVFRSYTQLAAVGGAISWDQPSAFGWSNIPSSGTLASREFQNVTFNRSWTLTGLPSDTHRILTVTVSWVDRRGRGAAEGNQIVVRTVMAANDPVFSGSVGFALPQNSNLRQPRNRSLDIPLPAVDVGDNRSAFQFSSTLAVIFDNTLGGVVQTCNRTIGSAADYNSGAGCATFIGYIISGYVSRTDNNRPWPTGVSTAALTGLTGTTQCTYQQATNINTGVTLPSFQVYFCLLPVAVNTGWGGTFRLRGIRTTGNEIVCRFQYPSSPFANTNERNVQPYADVRQSLLNQNYIIESSATGTCPTVDGLLTTLHQNCRSSNPDRSTECPA